MKSCCYIIIDVLLMYQTKLKEARNVTNKIKNLKSELEVMTERFRNATEKYKSCYKTP